VDVEVGNAIAIVLARGKKDTFDGSPTKSATDPNCVVCTNEYAGAEPPE
jgi:hypothetical protein